MKNKDFVIQKIDLDSFIDLLIEIYEDGADYIDIVVQPNSPKDFVQILVFDEYLRNNDELTKEKLNDLLNG